MLSRVNILQNACIAPDVFSMTVQAGNNAHPGQFAMIYLDRGELLLPRPISICDATADTIRFVYQVVGAGTKILVGKQPGEDIKILAPIGKGFHVGENARSAQKKVALVGGGIGTPPLLLLAKKLKQQGAQVDIYLGFRSSPFLVNDFKAITDNIHIATDDGSVGFHGNTIDLIKQQSQTYGEFLACGPKPMLDALAALAAQSSIPCQLSMEERMACGLGTCVGCVLEIEGAYKRICTEGPVFYA